LTSSIAALNLKKFIKPHPERSIAMKIKKVQQVAKGMCKCKQTC